MRRPSPSLICIVVAAAALALVITHDSSARAQTAASDRVIGISTFPLRHVSEGDPDAIMVRVWESGRTESAEVQHVGDGQLKVGAWLPTK